MPDIIAKGYFLERDIKYRKSYHTAHWRRYIQEPERISKDRDDDERDTYELISAEREYLTELQEHLDDGDFFTAKEIPKIYSWMMQDHGIIDRWICHHAA